MTERLKEVAPGVWIKESDKKGIKIPDPCWLIIRKESEEVLGGLGGRDNAIFIFSNEEIAGRYIEEMELEEAMPFCLKWNEVVDRFGHIFIKAYIDLPPPPGGEWCQMIPLRKDI